MRNIWLITKREYLERVRTRSFIFLTLLLPAIVAAAFVLPAKVATMKAGRPPHLVVVTSTPQFGELVRSVLLAPSGGERDAEEEKDPSAERGAAYEIEVDANATEAERARLLRQLSLGSIDGYLWMTDYAITQRTVTYSGRRITDFIDKARLTDKLTRAVAERQLTAAGLSAAQADQLFQPLKLEIVRVEKGRESKTSGEGTFIAIFVMVMLLYTAVIFYGVSVMRSVLEEKNTHILEVLLSSSTATELMAGKLLGVGAVGLTQMVIWIVIAGAVALPSLAMDPRFSGAQMSPEMRAAFVGFFLLGYLLYSAIYAAIGAIVTTEQEGQQIQITIVLPLVVAVFLMAPVIRAPDSPVAVWTSMIPFFSPLLMYLRIAVGPPPLWQVALSLFLLVATIAVILVLCGRIYRIGVLMYGKRPTVPEILKWLKYARS
jgi:ABC-2 type transport system permease protein